MEWYLQEPDTSGDRKFQLYQEQIDFSGTVPAGPRHWTSFISPFGAFASTWLGQVAFAGALCAWGHGTSSFRWLGRAGQPVGKPWSTVRTPLINIAAVSEDQTANTYTSLLEMLDNDDIYDDYRVGTFGWIC